MKKHVKLYNRIFKALHKDDAFVLVLDLQHDEVITLMADAMRFVGSPNGDDWRPLAEAALSALQCGG